MVSDATLGTAQSLVQPRQNSANDLGITRGDTRTSVQEGVESLSQETRPSGTEVAETNETETRNNGQDDASLRVADENSTSVQFTGTEERGSVVDITV